MLRYSQYLIHLHLQVFTELKIAFRIQWKHVQAYKTTVIQQSNIISSTQKPEALSERKLIFMEVVGSLSL